MVATKVSPRQVGKLTEGLSIQQGCLMTEGLAKPEQALQGSEMKNHLKHQAECLGNAKARVNISNAVHVAARYEAGSKEMLGE